MRALVAAVLAAAVSVGAAGSSAVAEPDDGLIAFAVDWPVNLHPGVDAKEATRVICGVDLTGRHYRLTQPEVGALHAHPSWSPDGRRLAYTFRGSFDAGIVLTMLGSGGEADGPTHAEWPALSPDGTHLAYQSPPDYTESRPAEILMGGLDGGGARLLAGGVGPAAWSPDGTEVVFAGPGGLVAAPVASGPLRPLPTGRRASGPDWSPDGRTIVFLDEATGRLRLIDADGRRARPFGDGVLGRSPAWSPSGRSLAFVARDGLRTAAADGSGSRRLYRWVSDFEGLDWQPAATPELLDRLPPCMMSVGADRRPLVGSRFGDVLLGSAHSDRVTGLEGDDIAWGLGGDDRVLGGAGNDQVSGDAGRDVIDGGSGRDVIEGSGGSDTLIGGAERDVLRGGPGNDVLRTRDRARDRVACGAGRDLVVADRADRIARDCERVRRG